MATTPEQVKTSQVVTWLGRCECNVFGDWRGDYIRFSNTCGVWAMCMRILRSV